MVWCICSIVHYVWCVCLFVVCVCFLMTDPTVPTGCTPVDLVPPCVHVFLHYGAAAQKFGVLVWYMLMAFERFNKKIKNLVGNATHPLSSLKADLLCDAGNPYPLHHLEVTY